MEFLVQSAGGGGAREAIFIWVSSLSDLASWHGQYAPRVGSGVTCFANKFYPNNRGMCVKRDNFGMESIVPKQTKNKQVSEDIDV
jgi:hypothetical protein